MAYIQYAGSPDIFDEQGNYIRTLDWSKNPQITKVSTPRPDIKTEADFSNPAFKGTNIQKPQQQSNLSESGQYYKSGNDVYRASDNAHITMDNPDPSLDFNKLNLNFALLPQGQAPVKKETTGNSVIDNALSRLDSIGDENAKTFSAILKEGIQPFFDNLMKSGQTINPNIEITPEKTAEFLTQAQKEISPYYQGQMRIAREGLLREAGYTSDEINAKEAQIEKQYGQSLRTLGGNMAESGFALSGQRQEGERTLAEDTQSGIDQARKAAEYNASSSARQFASDWGGSNTPQFNYGATPKVQIGQEKFSRNLDMKPFYSISDSVLSGLTGSQQYNEQAQTKSRASELEGLFRTQEANKQRLLNL